MRHNSVVSGHPKPTRISGVDGLSTGSPGFGVSRDISSSPFVHAILSQEAPSHFSLPKFHMYDGLQDPFNHLMNYRQIMTLQMGNNALLCKVFPSSLASPSLSWFHRLAPNSVTSFLHLSKKYVS